MTAAPRLNPAHTKHGLFVTPNHQGAAAPARLPFLLLLFFWVSKRKEDLKTQKKFISPLSTITQIKRLLTLNPFA